MDDSYNEDSRGGFSWVITIIALIILGWIAYKAYENYRYGEKEPFWKGTQLMQICKVPYYSSDECYRLRATLIDDETVQIHFKNGGYIYTYDLECWFTTPPVGERYVFCRSWDADNQQWDFAPLSAYY